ncbi:MAG TPA: MBL fold metallo-hydrolase [Polyangiales bacterium]|nr:MBL fold metallo-hydrolase [Polyangiales bacterium]
MTGTVKQEQQPARSEIDEVAPSVLRMQLPIQIPGLRHVNMYCLRDARGIALIDPGLPDEASWQAVQERLKQADFDVKHVHTVIVTHSHPDHFGGAARLHAASGARVIAHESFSVYGEQPQLAAAQHLEVSVEHLPPWPVLPAENTAMPDHMFIPWGGAQPSTDDRDRRHWERIRASTSLSMVPPLTHVVRHDDVIELCDRKFRIVHSPGHTSDHICLLDMETGTLFSGDHVLPTITPHISGLNKLEDPLQAFFDSLERMLELRDVSKCLPAHGDLFLDLSGRVEAIKRHHSVRLNQLVDIARGFGKAATVRDYSQALFPERAWGIMADSETYAHLEHLRILGRAGSHRADDGQLLYEA